jgi:hypothetical protein
VAQYQDEERVGDPREDAVQDPQRRVVPVGAAADHARDQRHAEEDDRDRRQRAIRGPLAQRGPGEHADEDHLGVAEDRGEAGAHGTDRVVPEGQVRGEEEARDPGEAPVAPRARAVPAPLVPGQEREDRQRVQAAEEGRRGGRHLRQAHEDPREGDHQRAEHACQYRPVEHGDRD